MPGTVAARSLTSPVASLSKVKPTDAKRLSKLGIETIRDLLLTLPFDWEIYGAPRRIAELRDGEPATVVGRISSSVAQVTYRKRVRLTQATLTDDDGGVMRVVWFNQPYLANRIPAGARIALAGHVKSGPRGLEMRNPHYEPLQSDGGDGPNRIGGLMPKYHLVAGITSKRMAEFVAEALPLASELEELLPPETRLRMGLVGVVDAVRLGHQPRTQADWQVARKRMAFAELFELQAAFALMRANLALEPATPVPYRQDVIDAFKAGVGFELTNAQRRSTWDAFQDMQRPSPMNRLLNGDVGSGKTAVAAACVAMAHAAGLQSVVMAPTEILARQHLGKFRAYLEASFPGLTVELLVSSQSAPERRRVRTAAASGHCALVVGTQALIEEDVEFAQLGLAVVDEQHRFGTRQRELLRAKGSGRPHFLAMTATPIPRTLALALYGEMAVSVIDELPPGRTPVTTEVISKHERGRAYDLVREQVRLGRQAFVICPLIEESEVLAVRSATAELERLRKDVFPDLRLDLVHGRMRDKEAVMQGFVARDTDVLVATAVVEVGVDVPNATVMMIEGSERFGLAQLHQFRGRVGRGSDRSYCLLLTDDESEFILDRLELVARTPDGFRLATEDMNRRGVGELMGARQHGMSDAAMQALREPELLNEARQEAEALLAVDPDLSQHPELAQAVVRRLELTSIS
ncbi:MAG TPA: ATP-dependent DNA helicase RecG [Candidatus Polarisedimenticolia bacterium]|nr:ATP-dependent DNA helicase RecG [Candidatus Polarisedimenticolia bacterium]